MEECFTWSTEWPSNLSVQETFGLQIHIQPYIQFMQALPYVHISLLKLPEAYSYRFNNLHNYSGRKLTRFGRSVIWSFLMSFAVTLQPSKVRDFKFLSSFKWRSPELVIREFETFKETNPVSPAFKYDQVWQLIHINNSSQYGYTQPRSNQLSDKWMPITALACLWYF